MKFRELTLKEKNTSVAVSVIVLCTVSGLKQFWLSLTL